MQLLEVRPVRTRREREVFLTFPWRIFKGDPLWVPPLLPDWQERTDPQRGAFFRHGEAEFFIAWRGAEAVGTVCAAEDREMNAARGVRECVFGFFNFVEDYAVMEALLARVREWAAARGLNALTGPFNLDYEDSYGILVEGRDRPPALLCGHTPPYYLDFVERYGFQPVRGDNIAFALEIQQETPPLQDLARMAERVRARGRFTVRAVDLAHWDDEVDLVTQLFNVSLAHLPDFRPWPRATVENTLAPFRKLADPELVLFGVDAGKTIGWLPGIPDLNEAFIHVNGLRRPWDYFKLAYYLRKHTACLTVKSVLLPPEYWGSGVAILLFDEMVKRARARGYRWIDCSLTSADNPRTPALGARFGAPSYKRYRVYHLDLAPGA